MDASGNITVSSFNQDTYPVSAVGPTYVDALGINGTSNMTGNIDSNGTMTFTPIGREAMFAAFTTRLGVAEWNRDNISGLYDTFTTGASTNRSNRGLPAFTMTGTALTNDGSGSWAGTLVSARNLNNNFGGFAELRYSELWDISITAVPVPAAVWLFGSGLAGLIGVARRKHKHNKMN